jgi:cAMP-dependent protein kinase regulator
MHGGALFWGVYEAYIPPLSVDDTPDGGCFLPFLHWNCRMDWLTDEMQNSRSKRSCTGDGHDSLPDRRFRRTSWGEKETDSPPDLRRQSMSLPAAYQSLIDALTEHVRRDPPIDILQFCADFFLARLAAERQSHHIAATVKSEPTELPPLPIVDNSKSENMSSAFTSPFGANANPFGGGARADSASGMQQVIEEEEGDTVASPTTPSFGTQPPASGFRAPFGGGDAATDGGPTSSHGAQHSGSYPTQYNFGRRTSVSAESLKPVADGSDNWQPPVHQKTSEQLERLKAAIQDNFLFSHLDDEQSSQVLGALVEKPIPAKDIKVCDDPVPYDLA